MIRKETPTPAYKISPNGLSIEKCKKCDDEIIIECGYEAARHKYCYQCSSIVLDEIHEIIIKTDYYSDCIEKITKIF